MLFRDPSSLDPDAEHWSSVNRTHSYGRGRRYLHKVCTLQRSFKEVIPKFCCDNCHQKFLYQSCTVLTCVKNKLFRVRL